MEVRTRQFRRRALEALADDQIQRSLANLGFDAARQQAIQEITPEVWERLRQRAWEIKRHTLDNLDHYLGLLTERVERIGGHVHFARDAQQATAIVLDIARSRGVQVVTKGKSMVSEEIALTHALEDEGIDAVETDLGEYILQLAQEAPFHLVAPALHKSRHDVANLFARKLRVRGLTEIPEMARTAREVLRQKFLKADMGITGVNFAVAETGTVVVLTNEGNGRLCTSLPRLHVALMGMEKVVPALEDLAIFLRLLPRAATGQQTTSYVTFVSGPRRRGDEDGPEEFHLVILDNGRSKLLADPHLREALACIRCGACLNTCPVYRKVGGHAYGWVYPGPIGAVLTPMLTGLSQGKNLPFASTLCGACRDVCPVKIDIPQMLLKMRHDLSQGPRSQKSSSWMERLSVAAWAQAMRSRRRLGLARRVASLLQRPWASNGRIRGSPLPLLSRWTRSRDFPTLAPHSFHTLWERGLKKRDTTQDS